MIITVKNLQQQTFMVEFEPEKTVLELKKKIFIERGSEYIVEKQKLIYAGVILDDDRTIASYNVDEKKFVVVMLKREIGGFTYKPDDGGASVSVSDTSTTSCAYSDTRTLDIETKKEIGNMAKSATSDPKGKGGSNGSDEDTKSVGSGDSAASDSSGGAVELRPNSSATSIFSSASGRSLNSAASIGSGGSETSHSTYSSSNLAGVFSNTSLQSRAESNLLMGEEYNRTVESMIEMGYCREMVERAMAASFNNPERAVEYLISGIPATEDGFNVTTAAADETILLPGSGVGIGSDGSASVDVLEETGRDATISDGGGDRLLNQDGNNGASVNNSSQREGANSSSGGSAREDPFQFLRNQPQFVQMRSLVYQNPDLLHAVLQQIGQTNPALLQLISENQDAFLSMLNQPMEGQTGTSPQYPRRITPGRRAQLAAAAQSAGGGDGLHVRSLDTAAGAGGDGPQGHQRPGESGDAGADTVPHETLSSRLDRVAERRAAAADAFMRERAAAAAAVAALTATASEAVDRDSGAGDGGGVPNTQSNDNTTGSAFNDNVADVGQIQGARETGGVTTIRLTSQDHDAIERLKALGFPESLVLQAYFACEKDEQLAANFLISSSFDD